MYKWKNRFLAFMMAMVLTFTTVPSASATELEVYNTSNQIEENIQIIFEGSNIIFKDFPDSGDFNYVMISLRAEEGGDYLKEYYSTDSDITVSVTGLEDGIYYIQMYRAAERYTSYEGCMWGKNGVKLNVKNGIASYSASPVYAHNEKVYDSNMTDKAVFECYLKPSGGVESDEKKIIKLAKSIVSKGDSDYEKVRKVHDWVANNVWYDYDSYGSGSYGNNNALEVLESKKAVCQGYANLSAALLRALGIPAKVVSGYALGLSSGGQWTESTITGDKTNHAWNEVFVDGRWVIFDATWDSNNEYRKGTF